MINVHIMHNQDLVQQGLSRLLDNVSDIKVQGKSRNICELFAQCPLYQTDVILLIQTYSDLQTLDIAELKARTQGRVLVMACLNAGDSVTNALLQGADGYILATDGIEELVTGITRISEGRLYMSSAIGFGLLTPAKWRSVKADRVNLTESELELLKLIGEGFTNQEIAERLFISKRTVEGHRSNLMLKTETRNSASLIKFAVSRNLLPSEQSV